MFNESCWICEYTALQSNMVPFVLRRQERGIFQFIVYHIYGLQEVLY